jgi:endonuclease/exonuclease/phosphatase family metal-dependent hydrolase
MELIYHIKNPNGVLRWENRFALFKKNKPAVAELMSQDIVALQECTSPSDIEDLFRDHQGENKRMAFISHTISRSLPSTDNIVIAYDQNKFKLVESTDYENPLKTSFKGESIKEGKSIDVDLKPAIYCTLQDKKTGELFIVASIHHPGGTHDFRSQIVDNIKLLQANQPHMPFFIAGDYNHTAQQFSKLDDENQSKVPPLFYPTDFGTMAGSDFGNTNKSIDAIMSNEHLEGRVVISSAMTRSPPAETPLNISFQLLQHDPREKKIPNYQSSLAPTTEIISATSEPEDSYLALNGMKKNILMALIIAKYNYSYKKYRPGYPQTNKDLKLKDSTKDLERFYSLIEKTDDPLTALNYLTDQLTDKKAHWGDYDFNNYLIDALKTISRDPQQSIASIDWDCFTPTPIKRFEGVVYRGTSSPPERVFNSGFNEYVRSNTISDYIKFRNLNTGISTSRSYNLAESYTRVASRQGKSRFVYTILYRGVGAVDIVETAKARGIDLYSLTNPQATKALEKDEVNIIDRIPREQILYATEFLEDGSQIIHKNPNYNPQYIVDTINYADIRHNEHRSSFAKIYIFFSDILSYLKVFIWSVSNKEQVNHYGTEYRSNEIKNNKLMQEAETLFNHKMNINSFELISAHLAVNAPKSQVINTQPEDACQIRTDVTTRSTNSLEIINDTESLSELVTLTPMAR